MAEVPPQERVHPCLLDRLTDDHPETQQESRDQRIVSMRKYKNGVLRDLSWLLNTSSHAFDGLFEDYNEAYNSVLNFGIPDMCGMTISNVRTTEIENNIALAIQFFEPRILPNSLMVRIHTTAEQAEHNALTFEIKGELWAQPLPDALYVRTEIDLETGQCQLKE